MHFKPSTATVAVAVSLIAVAAYGADAGLDAKARDIDKRALKIDAHTDVLLPGAAELNYAPGHTSRTDGSVQSHSQLPSGPDRELRKAPRRHGPRPTRS